MVSVFGWPDPNTCFDQSEHALYTCYFIITVWYSKGFYRLNTCRCRYRWDRCIVDCFASLCANLCSSILALLPQRGNQLIRSIEEQFTSHSRCYNYCVVDLLKEHSTKNILRCKQEIVLTLGYLRSLKGQFFLGKEELLIEVCQIPYRTKPCCLSQADA
jgi:hypothetical protein